MFGQIKTKMYKLTQVLFFFREYCRHHIPNQGPFLETTWRPSVGLDTGGKGLFFVF